MKAVGEVSSFRWVNLLRMAGRTATNGFIGLGIFWKAVAFFSFLALLARAELSWVVPATAISFVVETVAAKYLLAEKISTSRWAGAVCVCLGVALLSF